MRQGGLVGQKIMILRRSQLISTPRGFYSLLGVLVLSQFVSRGLLYPAAATDDAEQMLFSQVFRWGYDVVNPPLYTWLVIAVQHLVGIQNWSVSLVKFPLYGLIFHLMYLIGRRVIEDDSLIDRLSVTRLQPVAGGSVAVRITPLTADRFALV